MPALRASRDFILIAAATWALPPDVRGVLARLFYDLASDARRRADQAWFKNKGPMAVYWKAVGAYARHIARALNSRVTP